MINMNNILKITLGWAGAILGQLSDDVIRLVDKFSMKRIAVAPRHLSLTKDHNLPVPLVFLTK